MRCRRDRTPHFTSSTSPTRSRSCRPWEPAASPLPPRSLRTARTRRCSPDTVGGVGAECGPWPRSVSRLGRGPRSGQCAAETGSVACTRSQIRCAPGDLVAGARIPCMASQAASAALNLGSGARSNPVRWLMHGVAGRGGSREPPRRVGDCGASRRLRLYKQACSVRDNSSFGDLRRVRERCIEVFLAHPVGREAA